MEGTRNERVVVLVVSYIIGFITAYVAFGITQLEKRMVYLPVDNTASVIAALEQKNESPGVVAETKDGLVHIKNDEVRLLSAKMAAEDAILPDGYYTSLADYSLSPTGSHVYFCEIPADDVNVCRPYLYSVANDTVYPIKIQGERVAFDAEEQNISWADDGSVVFE
tara:strand:+ start:1182 stop:1679 length:498 start_codon:yes stop_codon:yes gene_type:complete